jgi:basic amino acid/polyamine antiporter, APA family
VPAIVNLVGVHQMAWFQNVTVVLKFLPLPFVGVIGWFFFDKAHFGPFNATGGSLYSGIGIAAGVALFSFIGVEAAAITAKRVTNPRLNVGRASLIGTAASAVLYVLVTAAVMGLVPHDTLVNTGLLSSMPSSRCSPALPGQALSSPRSRSSLGSAHRTAGP